MCTCAVAVTSLILMTGWLTHHGSWIRCPLKGCEPKSKNTHLKTDWRLIVADVAALLRWGGPHLRHGKGYWWTLRRIVIKKAPLHPSLADVIAVISILLIYYFPQHPPPPLPSLEKNVHRLFLALMIEELITNSPAPNEMVLLNY